MKTNNDEVAIEDLTENLILKVPRVSFGYKKNTIRIAYYTLITLGLPLYMRTPLTFSQSLTIAFNFNKLNNLKNVELHLN